VGSNPTPSALGRLAERLIAPAPKAVQGNTYEGSNPSPSAATPVECEPGRRARPPLEAGGWPNGHEGQVLHTPPCPRRLIGQDAGLSSRKFAGSSPVEGTH
jgi:hypothetical protein